jgi:hypothetical protein
MIEAIISFLLWLSAPADVVQSMQPRAAACASMAYSTIRRASVEEPEVEEVVEQASGEGEQAPPKKRVKKCVNGKCYYVYE